MYEYILTLRKQQIFWGKILLLCVCVCVCVYVCAMQETQELWVWSLGQEDSLKEENGNPLQYFCMKNPMDMLGS